MTEQKPKPNLELKAVLDRIRARKANMRYTDGTVDFVREARNGAMYGEMK